MHATPKEKQWEQNVTMVDEYSRIEVAASIVKSEGESVTMPTVIPGKGCCGDKVAEEEEPVIVTSASLESSPPPKPQPPPPNYVRRARERRALREWKATVLRDRACALREWEATVLRDKMNGRDLAAILEERNQRL